MKRTSRALSLVQIIFLPLALNLASQSVAGQVTRYEYDALGRLIKVERERPNNTLEEAEYTYDAAGNRTRVETSDQGSGGGNGNGGGPQQGFVVTPLSGYTLIFYQN